MVDMTAALLERAGIPQVARQTAWLLSQDPKISTSALFLSIHEFSKADRYSVKRKPPLSMRDDAEYLADIIGNTKKSGSEIFDAVRRVLRTASVVGNPLIPFEPGLFTDVIWENYFAPTLPPHCREFLPQIELYRSPLTRAETLLRLRLPLPLARLNTSDVDFIIFQNPTAIRVSSNTIKIIRLHDLVPLLRFDTQPQVEYAMQDFYESLAHCVKDSYFACVSESTRKELVTLFPQVSSKAFVIPNSVTLTSAEAPSLPQPPQEPYFLAVGTIEPRKNYRRLLEAFRTYRVRHNSSHRLVIVGHSGWHNDDILKELTRAEKEGWLTWHKQASPDELTDLYRNAFALIAAAVHEGFGIPPIEAAVFGTPSVLSSLLIFQAHFGDAAEYFDPYDPVSIVQALIRMTSVRRDHLGKEVREKARQFETRNELLQWQRIFSEVAPSK